jgi:hypothetical protein
MSANDRLLVCSGLTLIAGAALAGVVVAIYGIHRALCALFGC